MRRMVVGAALGSVLVLGGAGTAGAAHNGNNSASLVGAGAEGNAIVNYAEGRGTFTASVNVSGLDDGVYTFQVVSPDGLVTTEICTFDTTTGRDGCSATDLTLGGFATAEVVDEDGEVVAEGTFDRRGNCRDADQAGSLCEANAAPGQNK